jgi:hypothetical protein
MTESSLFMFALLYRVLVLLIIRTSYVPDEYFQHQEPAFKAAFPECITELTWEWSNNYRIRSYLPLLPLIWGYSLCSFFLVNQFAQNGRLLMIDILFCVLHRARNGKAL